MRDETSLEKGRRLAAAGEALADYHAVESWRVAARQALADLAAVAGPGSMLTTDDVWRRLADLGVERPREPRAMAAVVRSAIRQSIIRRTGYYRPTKRSEAHGRPVAVYEVV
jgi:hypothetical protein